MLVKWWGLAYDACTWERVDVHPDLPKLLHLYRSWHRQSVEDRADSNSNGATAAARAIAVVKGQVAASDGGGSGSGGGGSSGGNSGALGASVSGGSGQGSDDKTL